MSARDDILAGLRAAPSVGDETPEELLDALIAEVRAEVAAEIEGSVPPLVAGPRTQFERGVIAAARIARTDETDGAR